MYCGSQNDKFYVPITLTSIINNIKHNFIERIKVTVTLEVTINPNENPYTRTERSKCDLKSWPLTNSVMTSWKSVTISELVSWNSNMQLRARTIQLPK